MNTNRALAEPFVCMLVNAYERGSSSSLARSHLPRLCVKLLPVGQCMRTLLCRHDVQKSESEEEENECLGAERRLVAARQLCRGLPDTSSSGRVRVTSQLCNSIHAH
jgi:hypothetical protein